MKPSLEEAAALVELQLADQVILLVFKGDALVELDHSGTVKKTADLDRRKPVGDLLPVLKENPVRPFLSPYQSVPPQRGLVLVEPEVGVLLLEVLDQEVRNRRVMASVLNVDFGPVRPKRLKREESH